MFSWSYQQYCLVGISPKVAQTSKTTAYKKYPTNILLEKFNTHSNFGNSWISYITAAKLFWN